ncbi:MAG: GHKL domain-containing protein [Gammaproteobacteria bacterium]|nr:GHKL domain-containing protein [Gammaproteobacteria bacterium]
MSSLQTKLGGSLLLSLVVSFVLLWLLLSINIQFLAQEYVVSRLQHDSETLLSSIIIDADRKVTLNKDHLGLIFEQPFSGHYFAVSTGAEIINSRSLWDFQLRIPAVKLGEQKSAQQAGPDGQELMVVSSTYLKKGQLLAISMAEDLTPLTDSISRIQNWFILIAFSILVALLIIQRLILKHSLKVLHNTHQEIKQLEMGAISKLSLDAAPSELKPLIEEVNYLLVIMQKRLTRSRNALSDLAHAIKKPLTVMQLVVDKDVETKETKQVLLKQTESVYQISDRILKKARLAGQGFSGALFSFEDDLPVLLETLKMIHAARNIQLKVESQYDNLCPVDNEDMLELLGNLLDNAYKWATSNIILSIQMTDKLSVIVEDDGSGVDIDKLSNLSSRGLRLDENVDGHGFGLSIVSDIVDDYKGDLSFSKSTLLEGLKVSIYIPVTLRN